MAANRGFDPVFCLKGKTWVRIPRPKIDKLACQAQGAGIFVLCTNTLVPAPNFPQKPCILPDFMIY